MKWSIIAGALLALAASHDEGIYEHLLRDNYETPLYAPELNESDAELHRVADVMKLRLRRSCAGRQDGANRGC